MNQLYVYTYIPISPPSCVSLPPSLSHPSRRTTPNLSILHTSGYKGCSSSQKDKEMSIFRRAFLYGNTCPSWGWWVLGPSDGSATAACTSPTPRAAPPPPHRHSRPLTLLHMHLPCTDGQSFPMPRVHPAQAGPGPGPLRTGDGGAQGPDATDPTPPKKLPLQGRREWPGRSREGDFWGSGKLILKMFTY